MSIWAIPEAVADLQAFIADRLSSGRTSEILSDRYERVSRNACIGKARRLNLVFHSEQREAIPRPRRHHPWRAKQARGVSLPPLPFVSLSQADHAIPAEQRKQLLELTNETCRWPCNSPGDENFYFCGAPEAELSDRRPYCIRHSRVAYRRAGQIGGGE